MDASSALGSPFLYLDHLKSFISRFCAINITTVICNYFQLNQTCLNNSGIMEQCQKKACLSVKSRRSGFSTQVNHSEFEFTNRDFL